MQVASLNGKKTPPPTGHPSRRVWFQGSEVPSLTRFPRWVVLISKVHSSNKIDINIVSASHFQASPFYSCRFFAIYLIYLNEMHLIKYCDIVRKPTHQTPSPPWAVLRWLQPACGAGHWSELCLLLRAERPRPIKSSGLGHSQCHTQCPRPEGKFCAWVGCVALPKDPCIECGRSGFNSTPRTAPLYWKDVALKDLKTCAFALGFHSNFIQISPKKIWATFELNLKENRGKNALFQDKGHPELGIDA